MTLILRVPLVVPLILRALLPPRAAPVPPTAAPHAAAKGRVRGGAPSAFNARAASRPIHGALHRRVVGDEEAEQVELDGLDLPRRLEVHRLSRKCCIITRYATRRGRREESREERRQEG